MRQNELIDSLQKLGWKISKDEVGDKFGTFTLSDRIVSVIPIVKKVSAGFVIRMRESCSTQEFCDAMSQIAEDKIASYYSVKTKFGGDYRARIFHDSDIEHIAETVFTWANEVDIKSEIVVKTKLPTSSAGILPLHHLAALAIEKKTKQLEGYLASFRKADRLDFVPYITESHVLSALEYATR